QFITRRIGDGWITDFTQIHQLSSHASQTDAQEEFLAIKRKNKTRFIEFFNRKNKIRDAQGMIIGPPPLIDIDSLFDVQVKRIHEYKRQLMNALHLIMLYHEILEKPHSRIKRTAILGGKAAAGYEVAKDIIRLISAIGRKINRDPKVEGTLRVIFLEN